jgi:hypothetical protein
MVLFRQFDGGIGQRAATLVSAGHVGGHVLEPGTELRGGVTRMIGRLRTPRQAHHRRSTRTNRAKDGSIAFALQAKRPCCCPASAARGGVVPTYSQGSRSPHAEPAQASVPTSPAARSATTSLIQTDRAGFADRNGMNSRARRQASSNRPSQSRPKSVSDRTIQRIFSEITSISDRSLMDPATNTSQAAPQAMLLNDRNPVSRALV